VERLVSLIIVVLGFMSAQSAWAQASASDPTGGASTDDSSSGGSGAVSAPKRLSLLGISNTTSGLQSTSDPSYSAESDFNLITVYKFSDDYFLTGNFGFRKELTGLDRVLGQDGLVGIAHTGIPLDRFIKLTPSSAIRIPISDQSRNENTMYGGVQASLKFDMDGALLGVKRLSLTYIATLGRNFYEYQQASSGTVLSTPNATSSLPQTGFATSGSGGGLPPGTASPDQINIEYDLKNVALVNYQLSERFSLLETGIYILGYDYYGNTRGNFEMSEELDYQVAKQINVGIGFSNGGDVLKPDGQSSNVEIYNPNSANVYASIILTY
jgi:hypothetical protein